MPEPLTTLEECPTCGARDLRNFDFCEGSRTGKPHERASTIEVPVFSAGDMRAALERAEEAEKECCEAAAAADEFELQVDQARVREVELAEALRAFADAVQWHRVEQTRKSRRLARDAEDVARATLAGSPRSHEVVPLGTQEALVELVRLKDGPRDDAYRAAKEAAWQQARALVEGVERTPTPADESRGYFLAGIGTLPASEVKRWAEYHGAPVADDGGEPDAEMMVCLKSTIDLAARVVLDAVRTEGATTDGR